MVIKYQRNFNLLMIVAALCMITLVPTANGDESPAAKKPTWASSLSERDKDGYRYFVGIASEASTPEEALEVAWLNALSSAARTQFPFLLKISESATESLKASKYRRESTLAVERVRWDGIEDVSKFFEFKDPERKDQVTVYRLLRWKISVIEAEKARLMTERSKVNPEASTSYLNVLGKKGPPAGSLLVTSEPPGAIVLLDGEFVGTTNALFTRIGSGSYQLAIQLEGYETKEQQLVITAGAKELVDVKLHRNQGTVEITSSPSGAVVYVNNIPLPKRTPVFLEREHGDYDIRVEAAGHHPSSKVLSVGYQRTSESFILKAKPGKLSVVTNPSGAVVELDGEDIGKSNIINRLVPGGTHEVHVSKSGFVSQSKVIEVNEARGQTAIFNLIAESVEISREREETAKAKSNEELMRKAFRKGQITRSIVFTSGATISAIIAGVYQMEADASYAKYKKAETAEEAKKLHSDTEGYDSGAIIFSTISIGLLYGAAYNYFDWGKPFRPRSDSNISVDFNHQSSGISLTMTRLLQ